MRRRETTRPHADRITNYDAGNVGGHLRTRNIPLSRADAALGVSLLLLLSACGGGSSSSAGGSPAQAASGSAALEWEPVIASDLAGYRIHFGTASGSYSRSADAGTSTTWTLTNLSGGTRYYFVVTAVDTSGQESGYSNEVFKDIP